MIEALIAGERDPKALADLAIGKMRAKRKELTEALDGRFEDHHAELARFLLDQIDALTGPVRPAGPRRSSELIDPDPRRAGHRRRRHYRPGACSRPGRRRPPRSPGWTRSPAAGPPPPPAIIAEIGLDIILFGTPDGWCPGLNVARRPASPARATAWSAGKGKTWRNGILGEIAASASWTDTFLGERYRRLARRRGKCKALAAIARSVLIIIFNQLAAPGARFRDLGPGYYDGRTTRERKVSNHVRQLQALGLTVTIAEAA